MAKIKKEWIKCKTTGIQLMHVMAVAVMKMFFCNDILIYEFFFLMTFLAVQEVSVPIQSRSVTSVNSVSSVSS